MNKQKQAFTLVELIVVITILAILGTIAFISLQWYSKDTRNSVRLSDLSNIDKILSIKIVESWKVPMPDSKIDITASGTTFIYQWNAWERVLEVLWVSNWWKDPKDETYYTYATNTSLNKYQIIWFMEWEAIADNSFVDKIYAVSDLTDRTILSKWDELWILLDATTNVPLVNGIDIANTVTSYKAIFEEDILVEWTGWVLFSNFYNRNKVLLQDKELAKLDDSLVVYMDMETTTLSWATTVLKDFSQYWNHWECYDSWSLVDCWSVDWPQITNNYMLFDWIDDYIKLASSLEFNSAIDSLTVLMRVNPYTLWSMLLLEQNSATNVWRDIIRVYNILPNNQFSSYIWWVWDNWSWTLIQLTTWSLTIKAGEWVTPSISYDVLWNNSDLSIYLDWNKWWYRNINLPEISTWSLYLWCNSPDTLPFCSGFFNWPIDELRIYNRALSDNEIKILYESTK